MTKRRLKATCSTTVSVGGEQYQLAFYEPELKPAAPITVKELPISEQPAARLEHYGAGALSVSELLAIAVGMPSVSSAETLLVQGNNLAGLAQMPWSELISLKGIGTQRAARLKASFELGRRNAGGCAQ